MSVNWEHALEHVPEKLSDFSIILDVGYIRRLIDENMLIQKNFEHFPLDRMEASDREENTVGGKFEPPFAGHVRFGPAASAVHRKSFRGRQTDHAKKFIGSAKKSVDVAMALHDSRLASRLRAFRQWGNP